MKPRKIFGLFALLISATAAFSQTFQYNTEYRCNNERVVVAYCRNDRGTQVPPNMNYCSIHYPGQRTPSGYPVEKTELRADIEYKLRACGALSAPKSAASQNSTAINFNGLYVEDTETSGSRRWLRFYEDGSVVGATVLQGESPEQIAVWLKKGSANNNGQYTIQGSSINFFVEFKTVEGGIGKIIYSGAIGNNSLIINSHSLVTGNRGISNYKFVPLTGEAATTGTGSNGATSSPSTGANDALTRGRALIQAKNYSGAMVELKEAIRLDPRFALAFHFVGIAQYNLKEYVVANAAFERALQLNIANPQHTYNWTGDTLRALAQYDKALSAYREAARVKPDYALAFNGMGVTYHSQKDYANAVIFYEQAARLEPRTGIYRKNAGVAYLRAGKKDEAMKVYNALAAIDQKLAGELLDEITKPAATTAAATTPRTPAELRLDEGFKFYNAKDYQKALASFQEALRLKPDFGDAGHHIGMSYFQLKQYPQAIAAFESAIKLRYSNPHFSHEWIGDTYDQLKQHDKAIAAFRESPASQARLRPSVPKDRELSLRAHAVRGGDRGLSNRN